MSRTSKYYIPKAIELAEQKLTELYLLRDIEQIDRKLQILEDFRSLLYPPHKAADEQPCALDIPALP